MTACEIRHDGRYSKSLTIGLEILSSFSGERPVLGIAELAERLELSRSTTHRYVATLLMLGLLEQDDSRRYRLSSRAADPGLTVLCAQTLRERARGPLSSLRAQTGHTVGLAILDGIEIRYIERLHGHRRGQYEIDQGLGVASRLPAHGTTTGIALIAHLRESERDTLLGELRSSQLLGSGVGSRRALSSELERVRSSGLAVGEQGRTTRMMVLAAPVMDVDGSAIAAIDVIAPIATFSPEVMVERLGQILRRTGERIAAA